MSIRKLGLSQIQGSLVALDHCEGVSNEEMVQIQLKDGRRRSGRVVQIQGDKAIIQVFEGTDEFSKTDTKTKFLGHPMELGV